ncbi:MAG: glycosyltransferase family 2 protein [Armatimonadota bacterium]
MSNICEKIDISVIVPTRNEIEFINKNLDSLFANKCSEFNFEIIVVDGMSDDGTREVVIDYIKKGENIKLLDNPKLTTPSALNIGINNASGDIIIIAGAHSEYSEDYIYQCITALESTKADNVGGPWIAEGNTYIQKAIALVHSSPFAVGGAKSHNTNYEGYVDTVTYGCYKKEIIKKIGMFDEELLKCEDDELNYRLIRSGGKIWQTPKIKLKYYPRASIKSLFKQYFSYGFWKVKFFKKHKKHASIRHFIPGLYFFLLIVSMIGMLLNDSLKIIFILLIGAYIFLITLATIHLTRKSKLIYMPIYPIIFSCFHAGYGIGYIYGVLRHLILDCKRK